ncbi:multidrug efflux MFS transporter [Weissella bombi]|uniref:MFS transporter, DHA1 family, multidrug resistance protein n=1 Tax=Weissella bombi TaxID=1505725 RepID=A0A1C4BQS1_9LACO|nr:multidrug efflux MFS transporter [Weissella bombi]SCC09064.1 MFS transporter, DHA1 family, multidrug resistance protein [Weissella bombi]
MLKEKLSRLPTWQRNLFILWFGVFMTGIGFSEVMPFLSLYVDTLGDFTKSQLTFYSGLTFSITFLMTAIISPFWGKLADSRGRKLMLIRASLGMAIVFFLMGAVQNVWQLIFLRAMQGLFGGFISNSNAMIATQTPKEQSGYALGTLVTGVTGGQLLGPFIGGVLASLVSYRLAFIITGIIFLLVFLLVATLVKEEFTPVPKGESLSRKEVFAQLSYPKLTIGLFTTTFIIQIVNQSISPIISLFVRELNNGAGSTTLWAGLVAAMPGIATMLAAPRFGQLGDRIGTHRIMLMGFSLAFIFMLPTGFVTAVWQLAILRFMIGISDATMLPAVQTLLTKTTPTQVTSRIFAYNQSFQSLGSVAGPIMGTFVAMFFDYSGIFIASALLIVVNACLFFYRTKSLKGDKNLNL